MKRVCWVGVLCIALGAGAWARGRPPVPKPKNGRWLDQKNSLWYMLEVPQPYNPKERYPLLVTMAHRDDYAAQAFNQWQPEAKLDQIFLATLNYPPGFKGDRDKRLVDMVQAVCKEYDTIDHRHLLLLGVDEGANAALRFLAAHPRVFETAIILNPSRYPDISRIKASGPGLASSYTDIYLTYDPKNKQLYPKYVDARRDFARRGLRIKPFKAEAEGNGMASAEEKPLALKIIRGAYSADKRKQLAAVWEAEADKEQQKKDEEARKLAEARAEIEGTPRPKEQPKDDTPEEDPDTLWLKANELQNDKLDYAGAIELYERLIEIAPNSDYAPVAKQRIEKLKADPRVRQAVADKDAGTECKRWLSLAGNYQRAGMTDKAIELYTKVIENHPETSFAAQARKELEKLKPNP